MPNFKKSECKKIIVNTIKEQKLFFENIDKNIKINVLGCNFSHFSSAEGNYKLIISPTKLKNSANFIIRHAQVDTLYPVSALFSNNIDLLSDVIYSNLFNIVKSPYQDKPELIKIIKELNLHNDIFYDDEKLNTKLKNLMYIVKKIQEDKIIPVYYGENYYDTLSKNKHTTCDFNLNNKKNTIEQLELLKLTNDINTDNLISIVKNNNLDIKVDNKVEK